MSTGSGLAGLVSGLGSISPGRSLRGSSPSSPSFCWALFLCTRERYVWIHVHLLMVWQTAQQNYQIRTKTCLGSRHCQSINTINGKKETLSVHRTNVSKWASCIPYMSINKPHVHFPEKAGLDVMQSNPLCRMHFRQYQSSSVVLGWLGDGDCYLMHRMQSRLLALFIYGRHKHFTNITQTS